MSEIGVVACASKVVFGLLQAFRASAWLLECSNSAAEVI